MHEIAIRKYQNLLYAALLKLPCSLIALLSGLLVGLKLNTLNTIKSVRAEVKNLTFVFMLIRFINKIRLLENQMEHGILTMLQETGSESHFELKP
ncbi:MAG: hypothetical protein WKF68_06365 [Daejeonella sp.]